MSTSRILTAGVLAAMLIVGGAWTWVELQAGDGAGSGETEEVATLPLHGGREEVVLAPPTEVATPVVHGRPGAEDPPPPRERGETASGGFDAEEDRASEETQLTELGGYNGGLAYSPGGETIAFHRVADERSEIWLMGADGADPRPLTATAIDEYSPEWSPDGAWIAFTAGTGNDGQGTFDIWLMRADGSKRRVLNPAPNTEGWQKWRPGDHTCR